MAPVRRRTAAGVASAAVLLAALDAYVIVTLITDIMAGMGIPIDHPERATPAVTFYLLGYVAAMPLLGQLSDRAGRRRVVQGCLMLFAAGSAVSAAAPSLPVLMAGRLVQGAAGGALLPVTFAIIGDLWESRARTVPLGMAGAAQEMGSVIGPLYGAGLAALVGWRGVFWVNIPLAGAAMIAVQRSLPAGEQNRAVRVDAVGGLILAASLAVLIAGFYNPDPSRAVLPSWGPAALGVAVAGLAGFFVWEARSSSRLIDPAGLQIRPYAAALACSFLAGTALMVTLVDVPLMARTLLGRDTVGGALILSRFLVALAAGAAGGGLLCRLGGEKAVATGGFVLAAAAFLLISRWPVDILAARHNLGFVSLPRIQVDLALAGLGLGLVISPVASVALAASSPEQHGVVSAGVVVARMMGMLIGIAALGAAGVYRFQRLTARLAPPLPFGMEPEQFRRQLADYRRALRLALHTEYGEIFTITAGICLTGAFAALALRAGSRSADQDIA